MPFHGGAIGAKGHDRLAAGRVRKTEQDECAVTGVGEMLVCFVADLWIVMVHQVPA
ncbi:hypothetical protein D3C77_736030 [compost metagenome]